MATKLYVGNLQWKVGYEQLQELFSQAGQVVSASVIADRYSGRSKGFGFVEMATEEDAQKAKEMFNGKEYEGRVLVVNDAKPKRDDDTTRGDQPAGEPGADDFVGAPVEGEAPVEPAPEAPVEPAPDMPAEVPTEEQPQE